ATRTRAALIITRPTWRTGTATRSSLSRRPPYSPPRQLETSAGVHSGRQPHVPRGMPDLHRELAGRPDPLPGRPVGHHEGPATRAPARCPGAATSPPNRPTPAAGRPLLPGAPLT